MQAASLEKLETARALANEFAKSMNIKGKEARAAVSGTTQPNERPKTTTTPASALNDCKQTRPQENDTSSEAAIIENKQASNKQDSARINFGARYDADERNSTPKITAFEVAHWRNRLWLNPFLALSALLWFPFMTGLFSELLALNLVALGVISLIEYRLTRSICRALHTVKAPFWQRSWIAYIIRRGLVISIMLAIFILAIPFESWLVLAYLASISLYWLAQLFLRRKRHLQQKQQLAQFA